MVLLTIMFIIIIGISSACLCFNWYKEKTISVHCINFAVTYVKMRFQKELALTNQINQKNV